MGDCPVVFHKSLHDIISTAEPDHDNIVLSSDLILFNHPPPGMNHLHARDLTDIIMIAKHAIVKLKYRENQERLPTERLLIATVALDAEKVSRIRAHSDKPIKILAEVVQKLKQLVGFMYPDHCLPIYNIYALIMLL